MLTRQYSIEIYDWLKCVYASFFIFCLDVSVKRYYVVTKNEAKKIKKDKAHAFVFRNLLSFLRLTVERNVEDVSIIKFLFRSFFPLHKHHIVQTRYHKQRHSRSRKQSKDHGVS